MNKHIFLFLLLIAALFLYGCSEQRYAPDSVPSHTENPAKPEAIPAWTSAALPEAEPQEKGLIMTVNGTVVDVSWEDNETVAEILACTQNGTITVNTTVYGGFEQVGDLPQGFSRNDVQMTTEPGDIVLYSGDQLVVFFGSNTWSYTRLGHIGLTTEALAELLGSDGAVIELKYE